MTTVYIALVTAVVTLAVCVYAVNASSVDAAAHCKSVDMDANACQLALTM